MKTAMKQLGKSWGSACRAEAPVPSLERQCWSASLSALCSEVLFHRATAQGQAGRGSWCVRCLEAPPGGLSDAVKLGLRWIGSRKGARELISRHLSSFCSPPPLVATSSSLPIFINIPNQSFLCPLSHICGVNAGCFITDWTSFQA